MDTVVHSGEMVNGTPIYQDTVFTSNLTNGQACDSIQMLAVHVLMPSSTALPILPLGFDVWPNPFSSSIQLKLDNLKKAGASFEIINSIGERVWYFDNKICPNTLIINTEQWFPGIYFIFAKTSETTLAPIKLVKR